MLSRCSVRVLDLLQNRALATWFALPHFIARALATAVRILARIALPPRCRILDVPTESRGSWVWFPNPRRFHKIYSFGDRKLFCLIVLRPHSVRFLLTSLRSRQSLAHDHLKVVKCRTVVPLSERQNCCRIGGSRS